MFEKPGTLPKPGPIGRSVRIVFGCVLLYFFLEIITNFGNFIGLKIPTNPSMWLGVALSIYFLAYVVNVGFNITWGHWLQLILIAAAVVTVGFDLLFYQSFWGPPLGLLIVALLVYVTGHLGLSFILAGILATPGWELRVIPHVLGRIAGRESAEHAWQGGLTHLDRWEKGR